ncbi:50S ribosomal protein L3 [Geodia barretti]|uniref:Large ribosomal subunit protein uL3c n=1 Tax=Geodia barretti TaxID=519541 RepID=A0AA35SLT5_GEOBA|nr:50S ribosomal protein L3 [Geodia barretti]
MVTGIIGRKIGMTQVFDDKGTALPATVLAAGPCVVVQRKTVDRDGYDAVQLGLVEDRPARVSKPLAGHYRRSGVETDKVRLSGIREVAVVDAQSGDVPQDGEQVRVSLFAAGDQVDVVGESRGRGFQGVVKRHGFAGGRATHGSMFHRAPGSIGQSSYPSRVIKGMRGPGRMGGDRVTVRNLRIIQVDVENNRLVVMGAVPGAPGGHVLIRRAVAPRREPVVAVQDTAKAKQRRK